MRRLNVNLVRFAAATAVAVAALAGTASAVVPWAQPAGTVPGVFSWSNGQTENGLYGSPIVAGNSFTFFPNNFRAVANGGGTQTTTDRISFTLDVAPGNFFESFRVVETGDYSITNGGTVDSRALLTVNNASGAGQAVANAVGTPTFPLAVVQPDNQSNFWNIATNLNVLPNGWTRVNVTLDGAVEAASPVSGTSQIEKKVGGVTITVNIPEPATASILSLGAAALLRRRRAR
jgi:hypothetical protein